MNQKRLLKTVTRNVDAVIERSEADSHVIKILWSTGFKGLRSEWGERFYESLDMSSDAVNLERINSGKAPFLTEHERNTKVQLGVIQKAWLEDGLGFAEVKLSKNRNQDVIQDILDGILSNVSVGYSIELFEETGTENGIPVLTARKWTPIEISLVATPFDPQASVLRSNEQTETLCEIINSTTFNREDEMTPEEIQKLKDDAVAEYKAQLEIEAKEKADKEESDRKALEEKEAKEKAEREAAEERSAQLEMQVRSAGFDEETSTKMIEDFKARSLDSNQIAKEIIEKMKGKQTSPKGQTVMTKRELAEVALLNRCDARRFQVDSQNPYKQARFIDLIEAVVERNQGESDSQFVKRAIVTADLAQLLASVSHKLMGQEGAEKFSYSKWTAPITLRDFKETPIVQLGGFSLQAKTEGGDYAEASLLDSDEKITLRERGVRFSISQKAIINDDLGALKALPSKAQKAGHRDIESTVYGILNTNGNMSDGVALFHASHGNLIPSAGGTPSVSSLEAVNLLFAAMTDVGGDPLDLRAKYLIVPPQYEVEARQLASSTMIPNAVNAVNPYAGEIEVVVSSRITGNVWYAAADKEEMAAIVTATLEGQAEPTVSTEEHFRSSNMEMKVEFPNAAAAANYRAIVKVVV